jgi:hypothetical protein
MSEAGLSSPKRATNQNLRKGPLNFRLAPAIVREVKIEAAKRELRLNQLFLEMWQAYKRRARP